MVLQTWLLYSSSGTETPPPAGQSCNRNQPGTTNLGSQGNKGAWDWTELPCTVNEAQEGSQASSGTGIPLLLSHPRMDPGWHCLCRAPAAPGAAPASSPVSLTLKNDFLPFFRASRAYCHPLGLHLNPLSSECPAALVFKQWCPSFLIIPVMQIFKGRAAAHGPSPLLLSDALSGLTVHSVHKSLMQIRHCTLQRCPG